MGLSSQFPCSIDSKLTHVCPLAVPLVTATRLTERVIRSGDIEYVVHDLEEHAKLSHELAKYHCRRFYDAAQQQHTDDRCADQSAGLQLVQSAQTGEPLERLV